MITGGPIKIYFGEKSNIEINTTKSTGSKEVDSLYLSVKKPMLNIKDSQATGGDRREIESVPLFMKFETVESVDDFIKALNIIKEKLEGVDNGPGI